MRMPELCSRQQPLWGARATRVWAMAPSPSRTCPQVRNRWEAFSESPKLVRESRALPQTRQTT